jgi:hypothetical protein
MKRARFSEEKIIGVLKEAEAGAEHSYVSKVDVINVDRVENRVDWCGSQ